MPDVGLEGEVIQPRKIKEQESEDRLLLIKSNLVLPGINSILPFQW